MLNVGSGNTLLRDGTKPKAMFTYYQMCFVVFACGPFHGNVQDIDPWYDIENYSYLQLPRDPWVKVIAITDDVFVVSTN